MAVRTAKPRLRVASLSPRVLGAVVLSVGMIVSAFLLSRPREMPQPERQIVAEFDTLLLPVPRDPVPAGTKLQDIEVTEIAFPRHQLPDGVLTDLVPYQSSVTLVALPARLPIFAENLSSTGFGTNPVIERIPPGFRAMTVSVDTTTVVEGWARPGSIVDVLLVEKDRTSVVAERVKVLSLERSAAMGAEESSDASPSTVTLLVDQDQCLAINTAIPLGRIAFALRGVNDDATWARASYSADKLQAKAQSQGRVGVNGYVEIRGSNERYALSEGKWVKSDVQPKGFLAGKADEASKP